MKIGLDYIIEFKQRRAKMSTYFKDNKSSELSELVHELNSNKPDDRKEAAKQVIAMMTIGKDVSALFPHMVKCMET
jgi:vesicle coat complex subunit